MIGNDYRRKFSRSRLSFLFDPVIPEGEEDAARGDPGDPHEAAAPGRHGPGALPRALARVRPAAQRHPRGGVPDRDGEAEEQQPRGRHRREQQRPGPAVGAAPPGRPVPERVGGRRAEGARRVVLREEGERVGVAYRVAVVVRVAVGDGGGGGGGGVGEEGRGEGGDVVSGGHGWMDG